MDLNCDMGESFGNYKIGLDDEVIKHITSANIACGWHAGDPLVMNHTVGIAKQHNVGCGAHPGFPDLLGFGRRNMDCTPKEIKNYIIYQVGALKAFCNMHKVKMTHVKPHGNLYLTAVQDENIAQAVAEAIVSVDQDLWYVALAGDMGERMRKVGQQVGLRVVYEAFPDRAYTPDGNLLSRRQPGAVIKDPQAVTERTILMAKERKIIAIDGSTIEIDVESLCVHGDNPSAEDLVKGIKEGMEKEGVEVKPMRAV
ncbi:MAG: LamB/YcsF family protein [Desulfobacula sp.]|nr:LamB/YcsF family protein [Desulfobacula sp.]